MSTLKNSPQTCYVIGDIQGCCDQLEQLLELIALAAPTAKILFAGDLVNRGPKSLQTLRLVKAMGARADSVLGNHDLHLLAVANGIRPSHKSDTLDEILKAPDCEELLDWLRHRPLAILEQGHLLVHAGLFPAWSIEKTLNLAQEVEQILRGSDWLGLLREMYGNTPDRWSDALQGSERWRCIINALTRMRYCSGDGVMDFASKDGTANAPPGFAPWFDIANRKSANHTVIFGHWSTLGLVLRPDLISLDTGCVWGGKLTAISLPGRDLLQVECPQQLPPGKTK
ncbi:symmetrical bis(5'-nucleosyl)-tetraphosphatase [Undibacterium sp. Ren11W]|uniref:symmetrical bis(5'-nucleosyl)-tetraphosphatase n=1 Tax=Undibacterium sp. Ren11W TaxID=3413045 RepID=UPI003BF27C03